MKKLIKNLILITTILSLCFGFRVWAAADPDTYAFELSSEGTGEIDRAGGAGFYGKIVSATSQGNYTLLIDDCGDEGLVNTSQWNEYQSLLSQGSPEVIMVDIGWSESGPGGENFYVISGYQLAGQPEVKFPKENQIKIKDPFNCDHLSILKYLGNQLGSSYVFNQTKREQEIKDNNAKIAAEYSKERAKWAEMDEQIALGYQINAESNMNASTLPYTSDFLGDYCMKNAKNSQEKLYASFDNERNYVQQYLDKNGFKSISDFYNKIAHDEDLWDTGYDRDGMKEFSELQRKYRPLQAAKAYIENTESGKWPSDLSYGDYLRKYLKDGGFNGWVQINTWRIDEVEQDYIPTTARGYTSKGDKTNKDYWVIIKDMYNNNVEIAKMIEADLPVIASYTHLSRYDKTSLALSMILNSAHWITVNPMVSTKNINTGITTRELIDKWVEDYLPNIKESEIAFEYDERQKNNNLNDLLDPYNWEYDYGTNTVKKTNKWKH